MTFSGCGTAQLHAHRRPLSARARDRHLPAPPLHEAARDRESKAAPARASREMRFEDLRQNVRGNSSSIVRHFDQHALDTIRLRDTTHRCRHALASRVPGILEEIEEYLAH